MEPAAGLFSWFQRHQSNLLIPGLFALLYLLVVAFVVRRFAPQRRRYLRVAVTFLLCFVLCLVGVVLFPLLDLPTWSTHLRAVARFFLEAQFIHLTAVVAFFLVLPRFRIDVPDILRDLIIGTAYLLACFSLLRSFGVEIWSLLATSAVASIVIGVSLQPTLASAFGGVVLQLDGSVREGDWVRLPDKQEGKVREIRWRHTLIETRNGDTLVLPNAQLVQQQLLVLGRREGQRLQHRMWVHFSVDVRVDPERVIEVVSESLLHAAIENVSSNPRPDCICTSLSSSADSGAAQYAVRYWLLDLSRDDPTSSLVALRIQAALRRAGIPLAMPQRRVALSKEGTKSLLMERKDELRRRMELLSRVDLFDDLQPMELEALAGKLKPAPFCKGEEISRQGAEAHWLYILVSGSAEARVRLPSGADRVINELQAPDVFGEFGLLTGAPRRETIVATSRVECLRLDKAELRVLMVNRPEIAEDLSRRLAERQQRFEEALAAIGEAQPRHSGGQEGHLFSTIKRFFGLDDDGPPSRASRALPAGTSRELRLAGHLPAVLERHPAVLDDLTPRVGHPEGVGPLSHARGLDEIVVLQPLHRLVRTIFCFVLKLNDREAMVADLDRGPPGVAPVLEVVDEVALHRAGHVPPGDRDPPLLDGGQLLEGLGAQVDVAWLALGASIHDPYRHAALGALDLGAGAAAGRAGVVGLVHRPHHEIPRRRGEAAVPRAIGEGVVGRLPLALLPVHGAPTPDRAPSTPHPLSGSSG
ncbi:MAG: mechanosensitive ion channel family protein [Polyangiaceae bacterium]|jgi:small-conductance mechanosensitive channel|nr:mechanosensitive ion channel family protein [Polyangiaceae bacterium]